MKAVARSDASLTYKEDLDAQTIFNQYVEVDESDCIQRDELRSILLNLNLDISPQVLDDYIEVHNQDLGADSSRSGEPYTWDQFRSLYLLILRNQSTFFRDIYNGKPEVEIDLQLKLEENNSNLRLCFEKYDADRSGFLEYGEVKSLLLEMNLHKQFALRFDPQGAFDSYVKGIYSSFDQNSDGKISFEEFVCLYNALVDR